MDFKIGQDRSAIFGKVKYNWCPIISNKTIIYQKIGKIETLIIQRQHVSHTEGEFACMTINKNLNNLVFKNMCAWIKLNFMH